MLERVGHRDRDMLAVVGAPAVLQRQPVLADHAALGLAQARRRLVRDHREHARLLQRGPAIDGGDAALGDRALHRDRMDEAGNLMLGRIGRRPRDFFQRILAIDTLSYGDEAHPSLTTWVRALTILRFAKPTLNALYWRDCPPPKPTSPTPRNPPPPPAPPI